MTTKGSEFDRRIAHDAPTKEKVAADKLTKQTQDAPKIEPGKPAGAKEPAADKAQTGRR